MKTKLKLHRVNGDLLLLRTKHSIKVDLVLCTAGPVGLFMAGYTEDAVKRETSLPLLPGSIAELPYEFSRPAHKDLCDNPKIYSHIAPYMGGPEKIKNTNGAGDAALWTLLHDTGSKANIIRKCAGL